MGTHNRLLKIASERFPDSYLEIIAIDPEAPPPGRARWFGLDTVDLSAGPRLVHFVARSTMLDMHRWGLITVGFQPGLPLAASRETPAGTLSWQIVVREDGRPGMRRRLAHAHPVERPPPHRRDARFGRHARIRWRWPA